MASRRDLHLSPKLLSSHVWDGCSCYIHIFDIAAWFVRGFFQSRDIVGLHSAKLEFIRNEVETRLYEKVWIFSVHRKASQFVAYVDNSQLAHLTFAPGLGYLFEFWRKSLSFLSTVTVAISLVQD